MRGLWPACARHPRLAAQSIDVKGDRNSAPSVIPGPSEARSPESIITGGGYGFRARAFGAPRNDSGASMHRLGPGLAAAIGHRKLLGVERLALVLQQLVQEM